MGTEILKSFGTLQSELEQAKSSLKGVDENIKRLIGRDPSDFSTRQPNKRALNEDRSKLRINKGRNVSPENNEPVVKRKRESVFKRLSDKLTPYEELSQAQKGLISKVIVTPREVPSRQEALAAQSKDVKSKERNRRMFGSLLGTLQKFQQEETKLKQREDKRAHVEKKIEEHEIKEKAEIKKEKQELFLNRKKKQAEIKMIELKMMRMREYTAWEEKQKPSMNFIQTKTKPYIFYLPKRMNDKSKELLEESKRKIEASIEKKKESVLEELQRIEDKMKKNFEIRKKDLTDNEKLVENDENHRNDHEMSQEENVQENETEITEEVKELKMNGEESTQQIDEMEVDNNENLNGNVLENSEEEKNEMIEKPFNEKAEEEKLEEDVTESNLDLENENSERN